MRAALIIIAVQFVVLLLLALIVRWLARKNNALSAEMKPLRRCVASQRHTIEAMQSVMHDRAKHRAEVDRQTAEREATPDSELVDRANDLFPGGES